MPNQAILSTFGFYHSRFFHFSPHSAFVCPTLGFLRGYGARGGLKMHSDARTNSGLPLVALLAHVLLTDQNSGHFVPQTRQRAAHTFRSDQYAARYVHCSDQNNTLALKSVNKQNPLYPASTNTSTVGLPKLSFIL